MSDPWWDEGDGPDAFDDGTDDGWVHAANRRRRIRLRLMAIVLVVLIAFPIVITFLQRIAR